MARKELDLVLAFVNLVISRNEIVYINYLYILHHSENNGYLIQNYYLIFKRKRNIYNGGSLTTKLENQHIIDKKI